MVAVKYKVAYDDYNLLWKLLKSDSRGLGGAGFKDVLHEETKEDAVQEGRFMAKKAADKSNRKVKLIIENMDGRVGDTRTYGD
jgi:hypothetical protein